MPAAWTTGTNLSRVRGDEEGVLRRPAPGPTPPRPSPPWPMPRQRAHTVNLHVMETPSLPRRGRDRCHRQGPHIPYITKYAALKDVFQLPISKPANLHKAGSTSGNCGRGGLHRVSSQQPVSSRYPPGVRHHPSHSAPSPLSPPPLHDFPLPFAPAVPFSIIPRPAGPSHRSSDQDP